MLHRPPASPLFRLHVLLLGGLFLCSEVANAEIEEIVVTATKREESVRDIPVSIDAMDGEALVQQGATNLDQILKNTPGVGISGTKIDIRGVALSSQQSLGSAQEAGRFLGDVSLNSPSTQGGIGDFDPYDMRTVEVLKGPQATLFGGTALSGAIRYVPNKPNVHEFGASLRTGYGTVAHADDALTDVSAMVNVAAFDSVALRAVGTVRKTPNFIDDNYGGRTDNNSQKLSQFRYMARWEASERLTFDATYLNYEATRNFTFIDNDRRYETNTKRIAEPAKPQVDVGSLNVQYAFDTFSIVGIANYLQNEETYVLDGSPIIGTGDTIGAIPLTGNSATKMPSYELRLISNEPSESDWAALSNWDYLVGVYYMTAKQKINQVSSYLGVPALANDNTVDVSEKALFFNLTRHFFDGLIDWNIGARVAKTDLDADVLVTSAGVPRQYLSEVKDSRVNPNVALTWHLTDDVSLRTSFAEGFRFGGANSAGTIGIEDIPPTFESDSLRNYEVGLRSDWFDRRLRFDVTGFLIRWSDLQLTQLSRLAMGYVDNVGAATIKGVESQLIWQIPDDWAFVPSGLNVSAAFSYLNARTTEDFDSANGPAEKGTRLPLSPKVSGTVGVAWEHSFGGLDVRSSVQGYFAGSRTNALIETYRLPAYSTYAASLRFAYPSWPLSPAISLTGTNLTDEFVLYSAFPVTANPGAMVYVPQGQPRTVKLNLELAF